MARKPRLSKAARQRRREQRDKQQEDDLVQDTVALLGCSAQTAADMRAQCERRLDEIDLDLTFAGLAYETWHGRPGADELALVIEELVAEQRRHAQVMEALAKRVHPLAIANCDDHEHLDAGEVDPAHVRRTLFTPPEERPPRIDRQISTEPDRR